MKFDVKTFMKNKKFFIIGISAIVVALIISLFCSNEARRLETKELESNGNINIGSLVINEVMASNGGAYADANGKLYDWIELYNGNDHAIDLTNYGLSDATNEVKWTFPSTAIEPKSYLVVFLSGEKQEGLYAGFKVSSNGDESIYLKKPNGKVVDAVEVTAMDKNQVIARDLNGNWYTYNQATPGFENSSDGYKEFWGSITDNNSKLKINEVLPNNSGNFANTDGNYSGYIEITNEGNDVVNLKNYSLSNTKEAPFRYQLPEIFIGAHDTVVIYTGNYDNTDSEHYTGFKLNSKDGVAILGNNKGKVIDKVEYNGVPNGIALIKENGSFYQSSVISPGYSNNTDGVNKFGEAKLKNKNDLIINEVMNSNSSYLAQNGNEYYDWIELKNNSGKTINLKDYALTTNNDSLSMFKLPDKELKPDEYYIIMASGDTNLSNTTYTHASFKLSEIESLYLTKNKKIIDSMLIANVPLGYSMGRGNSHGNYYFSSPTPGSANNTGTTSVAYIPSFSVNPGVYNNVENVNLQIKGNGTVYYTLDGSIPTTSSKVYTGPILLTKTTSVKAISYQDGKIVSPVLSGSYIINENHTLPVLSISMNPSSFSSVTSNAWDTNLEVSSTAELYENGKSFNIDCGFKLFGGSTRGMSKQSFALKFRKKYGNGSLHYQVFDNRDFSNFDSLVIRSGSQDSDFALMRDILMTSLVDGVTNLQVQSYKTVILYINGNYWGVYNIREKVDKNFISNHFNVDGSKSNIIRIDNDISNGTIDSYRTLLNYLNNNSMALDKNYEHVKTLLNIESFVDYWAAESWITNNDIINTRFYSHPNIDNGRFNMIFYDLDYAMWNYKNNYFQFSIKPEGMSDFNVSTEMMRSLIKSNEFKKTYVERLSYQLKNVWNEDRVINKINELYEKLKPEMSRNQSRWGMTMNDWEKNVEVLKDYTRQRRGYIIDQIKSFFGLSDSDMKKYFGD